MKNVKCGVYKITNTVNGKFYIGSSKNIDKRWSEHIRELNKNSHANIYLQNAWNEYGEDKFKFEIIEECDEDIRLKKEQEYLETLMPFNRVGNGYNIQETVSNYDNGYNMRIYTHRYHCINPFYKRSKGYIKSEIKRWKRLDLQNNLSCKDREKYLKFLLMDESKYDTIDTNTPYIWYALIRGYAMVEYNGATYEIDMGYIDTHTKENIAWYIDGMNGYQDLLELGVFDDE